MDMALSQEIELRVAGFGEKQMPRFSALQDFML
jgi:hypothetical protein